MAFINQVSDGKLEAFVVDLVEKNYESTLRYSEHEGQVRERDNAGMTTIRVSAVGRSADLFYVTLDDYTAEVYCFSTGIRSRFDDEFVIFMVSEVRDKMRYAKIYNDNIETKIEKLTSSFVAQKECLENKKFNLQAITGSENSGEANC